MNIPKLRIFLNAKPVICRIARVISVATPSANKITSHLKSWKEIPGPTSLPLIGQSHHFLPGGLLHNLKNGDIWKLMRNKYGNIVKLDLIFTPLTILLSDPDCIRQVHHSENYYPRRPGMYVLDYYRRHYKRNNGNLFRHVGLGTDYGESWKALRSVANQVLLPPHIVQKYRNSINDVAQDMVARLKLLRQDNNMIPSFKHEMKLWALESICVIGMGRRINCFSINSDNDPTASRLVELMNNFFDISESMEYNMPIILKYYPTKTFKKAMTILDDLENTTQYYVRLAMKDLKAGRNDANDEKSILEKLLEIDEDIAVIMANDMMAGGVDTVTNTIMSVLYNLAKYPETQEKLRKSLTSNKPSIYLKACVKEGLRIIPIIPINSRIISKDHNILGFKIPKGTVIIFNHEHLSLDENQYPKPTEFIPERWTAEKDDPLYHGNAHPFSHQPFGFGVRSCIGRRIAELELEIILKNLIENFSFEWNGPPPELIRSQINKLEKLNFVINDVKN